MVQLGITSRVCNDGSDFESPWIKTKKQSRSHHGGDLARQEAKGAVHPKDPGHQGHSVCPGLFRKRGNKTPVTRVIQ